MYRRTFVATSGAAVLGAAAGCLTDEVVIEHDGQSISYIAPERVYEIWQEDEALFVDTRSVSQYRSLHISGAVPSPAPDGLPDDDPVASWSQDDPIIVYCPCPYELSKRRGATLLRTGYSNVRGLDKGFQAWIDAGYPVESGGAEDFSLTHVIVGETAPNYAGEPVQVRNLETGTETRTYIQDDGTFTLSLHFAGLSDTTPLEVETPSYTVTGSAGDLTATTLTASHA